MPRLMDLGLQRLTNLILNMGELSRKTVERAIDAYASGRSVTKDIFDASEELRMLQDEVSELAMELIARYQPVAKDLRFIKSCMEIAYGFSRFGRYAYDIAQVLDMFGDLSRCDRTTVEEAAKHASEMMRLSIEAFINRDVEKAERIQEMDDVIDNYYREHVRKTVRGEQRTDLTCTVSATLILRYLERIADHATYIGESVLYIVTGERRPRR